jgi:hypothetical protein
MVEDDINNIEKRRDVIETIEELTIFMILSTLYFYIYALVQLFKYQIVSTYMF